MKRSKEKKIPKKKLELLPEPFDNACPDRKACDECGLHKRSKNKFVRPFVPQNWTRKLLIVLPGPGGENVIRYVRRLYGQAGYHHTEVAIGWATLCGDPRRKKTMRQLRACRPFLLRTIGVLRPEIILGMGGDTLHALTNRGTGSITDARGRNLEVPGLREILGDQSDAPAKMPRVWSTFDPQSVLDGGVNFEALILQDLNRHKLETLQYPPFGLVVTDDIQSVDTEYDPTGELLTLGMAQHDFAGAWEKNRLLDQHPRLRVEFQVLVSRALHKAKWLVGHSIMGEIDQLVKLDLAKEDWVRGRYLVDTLIAARMYDENRVKGSYSLENLLTSEYNVEPWKGETDEIIEKEGTALAWSPEQRVERCRLDAWAARKLASKLVPKGPSPLMMFTHEIQAVLHRMYLAGAAIDMEKFHTLGQEWSLAASQFHDLIRKHAMKEGMAEFNGTNDNHIRELLYERHGYPIIARTEKDKLPKVDKATLKSLKRQTGRDAHELLDQLMQFNSADKLASTWYGSENSKRPSLREVIKNRPSIWETKEIGWLQNEINPLGAKTGRRSSGGEKEESLYESDARNSQNWPQIARTIIISRWPGGKILAVDYKRLEVVLCAWIAQDRKLFDYFNTGEGYIGVGAELFKITVEDGSQEYKIVKSIVLGTQYNMKEWKLATDLKEKLGITFADDWDEHLVETGKLRARYLEMFPGVARYIEKQKRTVAEHGMVWSPSGRRRHLPHHGSRTPKYWHLVNQAVNFPVQSFASEVTGSAAIDAEDALLAEHDLSYREWHNLLLTDPMDLPCSVAINEVHDELVFDIHPGNAEKDVEIILDAMRGVPTLRRLVPQFKIPLNLEVLYQDHWGEVK